MKKFLLFWFLGESFAFVLRKKKFSKEIQLLQALKQFSCDSSEMKKHCITVQRCTDQVLGAHTAPKTLTIIQHKVPFFWHIRICSIFDALNILYNGFFFSFFCKHYLEKNKIN